MDVAVIGAGNIGGTLARKWVAAGHRVILGVRDSGKPEVPSLVAEGVVMTKRSGVGRGVKRDAVPVDIREDSHVVWVEVVPAPVDIGAATAAIKCFKTLGGGRAHNMGANEQRL